jgi:diaminohydroxyphosphoribosylaminopyrimidine deaminase/5-amino-6-(5-phosphoribosylamino)uracil reductase
MHEKFMKQSLELASKGLGKVSPNPLVGSVIVFEDRVIGEGYHTGFGNPHAEVEAIQSVSDKNLLPYSTLYVNLEPCNHFGKTPPCTDLILEHKIQKVVICNLDPHTLVSGKGIARLKENGVNVISGILEKEGSFLNRRFFTFHSKKRPYIILKWAQTKDGFIDQIRKNNERTINKITSDLSHQLSHQWRSIEDAILVGKNTVLNDNPQLTTRLIEGKNPIRILIDKNLEVKKDSKIYSNEAKTIILNSKKEEKVDHLYFHKMNTDIFYTNEIMDFLYKENIQSVIIEGGAFTLQQFIDAELWDETRIFTSNFEWKGGIKSPNFHGKVSEQLMLENDQLKIYYKK